MEIRSDSRFTLWCAACDWNVDPGERQPDTGRLERAERALARRRWKGRASREAIG
ncbi:MULTISPECIES: hypothetical protein [Streptomyces]|uniref:hypothetical protein n=1 Tax=Streptomyces TaxID=1883 RepID=UPI001EFB8B6A|nr:hypothetical protein [Streptomyces sp. CL12-4]MCG8968988.1 hypothetical protein [Streptomyces sp. CL12-4]